MNRPKLPRRAAERSRLSGIPERIPYCVRLLARPPWTALLVKVARHGCTEAALSDHSVGSHAGKQHALPRVDGTVASCAAGHGDARHCCRSLQERACSPGGFLDCLLSDPPLGTSKHGGYSSRTRTSDCCA